MHGNVQKEKNEKEKEKEKAHIRKALLKRHCIIRTMSALRKIWGTLHWRVLTAFRGRGYDLYSQRVSMFDELAVAKSVITALQAGKNQYSPLRFCVWFHDISYCCAVNIHDRLNDSALLYTLQPSIHLRFISSKSSIRIEISSL